MAWISLSGKTNQPNQPKVFKAPSEPFIGAWNKQPAPSAPTSAPDYSSNFPVNNNLSNLVSPPKAKVYTPAKAPFVDSWIPIIKPTNTVRTPTISAPTIDTPSSHPPVQSSNNPFKFVADYLTAGAAKADKAFYSDLPKMLLTIPQKINQTVNPWYDKSNDPIFNSLNKAGDYYSSTAKNIENTHANDSGIKNIVGKGIEFVPQAAEFAVEMGIPIPKIGKVGDVLSKAGTPVYNAVEKYLGKSMPARIVASGQKVGTEMGLLNFFQTGLQGGDLSQMANAAKEGYISGNIWGGSGAALGFVKQGITNNTPKVQDMFNNGIDAVKLTVNTVKNRNVHDLVVPLNLSSDLKSNYQETLRRAGYAPFGNEGDKWVRNTGNANDYDIVLLNGKGKIGIKPLTNTETKPSQFDEKGYTETQPSSGIWVNNDKKTVFVEDKATTPTSDVNIPPVEKTPSQNIVPTKAPKSVTIAPELQVKLDLADGFDKEAQASDDPAMKAILTALAKSHRNDVARIQNAQQTPETQQTVDQPKVIVQQPKSQFVTGMMDTSQNGNSIVVPMDQVPNEKLIAHKDNLNSMMSELKPQVQEVAKDQIKQVDAELAIRQTNEPNIATEKQTNVEGVNTPTALNVPQNADIQATQGDSIIKANNVSPTPNQPIAPAINGIQATSIKPTLEQPKPTENVPKEQIQPTDIKTVKEVLPTKEEIKQAENIVNSSNVKSVGVGSINTDPTRFQFKENTDTKTGASNKLKGTDKWDNQLSNAVTLWQDKSNKLWVVNGHHRLELAKRNKVGRIDAKILKESDGITDKMAREIGALQNISENQGSPKDIAQVFRDGNYSLDTIKSKGLSNTDKSVMQGYHIAQLNDRLWMHIVNKTLDDTQGSIIGEALPKGNKLNEANQNAIYDYIQKENGITNSELKEFIDMVKASASGLTENNTAQTGLFGDTFNFGSNAINKVKLIAKLKQSLVSDKNAFAKVINKSGRLEQTGNILNKEGNAKQKGILSMAVEIIDKGKNKSGDPINAILDKYAEKIGREGMSLNMAVTEAGNEIIKYAEGNNYIKAVADSNQTNLLGGNNNDQRAENRHSNDISKGRQDIRGAKEISNPKETTEGTKKVEATKEVAKTEPPKVEAKPVEATKEVAITKAEPSKDWAAKYKERSKEQRENILKDYGKMEADGLSLTKKQEVRKKAILKGKEEQVKITSKDWLSTVSKDDLSYKLANEAYRAISFDPEKRAKSEQDNYVKAMTEMYNKLLPLAKTDIQKTELLKQMDMYKEGYLKRYNAILSAKARTMSAGITGPANFPVARNQKRMETEHNRTVEFLDWDKKVTTSMTRAIKYLSQDNVKQVETPKSSKDIASYDGAKIINNYGVDRTQIFFDVKPSPETTKALKAEGWHYSPSNNNAWQRKITNAAEHSGKSIVSKFYPDTVNEAVTKYNSTSQTDTPQFKRWFNGSKIVGKNGKPLVVFHGSLEDFNTFDISKIRHDETDAKYNGFWFNSDESYASPAWEDPKYVKSYYLAIKNPAPIKVANEVAKTIYNNYENYNLSGGMSYADITRLELQKMGYDGVIHQDAPKIDWREFDKKGEYTYTSNRGTQYQIVKNKENGGLDYNYANGENITGYLDKTDFIKQHSERIYVAFNPNQIKSATGNNGEFNPSDPNILLENKTPFNGPQQKISSANTSINASKLPATFNRVKFEPNTVNADIGGGKFDNATEYLKAQGVANYIYDPYNRNEEFNQNSIRHIENGQVDTATINNVLNVINEIDAREQAIANAANVLKSNGKAYFLIYEGNGTNIGVETSKGWQNNSKTKKYIPEISQYFKNVTQKGNLIIAEGVKSDNLKVQEGIKPYGIFEEKKLKTLKGSIIKRSKYGVGKDIGGQIYVSKDYATNVIPKEVYQDALNSFKNSNQFYNFNSLVYDPKTKRVRFDESPDFNTAREPIPGKITWVSPNGAIAKTNTSKSIWHHKWIWVKDDYKGFDVGKSYDWSKHWLSKLPVTADGTSQERWQNQLKQYGITDNLKLKEGKPNVKEITIQANKDLKKTEENNNIQSARGKNNYVAQGIKGLAINAQLVHRGWVDLRDRIVHSPAEVATVAQVFRDPRYETFRIVYMKGDTIVGHEGITSRVPDVVKVFSKDADTAFKDMKNRMARLGADGYYLLHNHPSGDPTPSREDINISLKYKHSVNGYKGHVVINSNKFALIGYNGQVSTENLNLGKDLLLVPAIENDLLGQKITSGTKFAEIAKQLQLTKNTKVILFVDAKLKVRAIQEVPNGVFNDKNKATDYLRGRMREFGSISSLIVTDDMNTPTLKYLVSQNIVTDVISNDNESWRDKGTAFPVKLEDRNSFANQVIKAISVKEDTSKYNPDVQKSLDTLQSKYLTNISDNPYSTTQLEQLLSEYKTNRQRLILSDTKNNAAKLEKAAIKAAIPKEPEKAVPFDELPRTSQKFVSGYQKETPLNILHKTYKLFVNHLHYTAMASSLAKNMPANFNIKIMSMNAVNAISQAEKIIEENLANMGGENIGKSLQDIYRKLPKKRVTDFKGNAITYDKLLYDYMAHQHNIDRMNIKTQVTKDGKTTDVIIQKPVFDKDYTSAMSKQVVDFYNNKYPELAKQAKENRDFWDKFMQAWAVDGNMVSPETMATLKEMYPHYMPTYRSDNKPGVGSAKKSFINQGNIIKKAIGSSKDIIDPLESYVKMIKKIVVATRNNEVGVALYETLLKNPEAMKSKAEIVPTRQAVIDEINKTLSEDGIEGLADTLGDQFDRTMTHKNTDNIVTVMIKGEPIDIQFNDKEMLKEFRGLIDSETGLVEKIARSVTGPFKSVVTGKNPLFALSNASRDAPDSYINSVVMVSPLTHTEKLAEAFAKIISNAKDWQEYKSLGGEHSNFVASDAKKLEKYSKQIIHGKSKFAMASDALGTLNNVTESVPRFAEYLATIKKGGRTYASKMQGIYNAAEVSTNFARYGAITKAIDSFSPYLNPAVQGVDKVFRQLNPLHPGTALKTILKGLAAITATTLLLDLVNKDNPHYQSLDNRVKDTYLNFPNPWGPKDSDGYCIKFIRLPKQREFGVLFGSLAERLVRLNEGKLNPFKGFSNTVLTNFLFDPLTSGIWTPLANIAMGGNKDFAGRNIVPQSMVMSGGSKYLQFDEKSTETAKAIAEFLHKFGIDLSPKQFDYIVYSYTGVFAQFGQPLDTKAITQGKTIGEVLTSPFTSKFITDSLYNNQGLTDLYENYDAISKASSDKNKLENIPGKELTIEEIHKGMFTEAISAISGYNQQIKEAGNDQTKIRELRQKILNVANETNAAMNGDNYESSSYTKDQIGKILSGDPIKEKALRDEAAKLKGKDDLKAAQLISQAEAISSNGSDEATALRKKAEDIYKNVEDINDRKLQLKDLQTQAQGLSMPTTQFTTLISANLKDNISKESTLFRRKVTNITHSNLSLAEQRKLLEPLVEQSKYVPKKYAKPSTKAIPINPYNK